MFIVQLFIVPCFFWKNIVVHSFSPTITTTHRHHSSRLIKSSRRSGQILDEPSSSIISRPVSDSELSALIQIKEALVSSSITYPLTDITMLRFLRGQKQDVSNAIHELITHVTWRNDMKVDELRLDTSSFAQEYHSRKCINEGFDRQGRPLVSMIARRHDKNQRQLDEVCKLIIHTLDTAIYRSRERLNDEKIVILFDMSEFSTSALDYEAVKLLINILLKNYPDILAASYIMNAPMLFTACWAIIRPWLDPITANKCVFVKPKQLAEHVDLSQLPSDIAGIPAS